MAMNSDAAAGNALAVNPAVFWICGTEVAGGNSLISAWPEASINARVLSSTTYFQVTEFK